MESQLLMTCTASVRSGHNAIIYWLNEQFDSPIYLFNNTGIKDPFLNFDNNFKILPQYKNSIKPKPTNVKKRYLLSKVMLNFENFGINQSFDLLNNNINDHFLNKPQHLNIININFLCIRDFYNNIASIYHGNLNYNLGVVSHNIEQFIIIWINHANEILYNDNIPNKFIIKYNDWCQSIEYRKNIIQNLNNIYELNIDFNDHGRDIVSMHGGYSSFDQREFQNKASEMKTLIRYKKFLHDKSFLNLFRDRHDEISDLNKKLFGFKLNL